MNLTEKEFYDIIGSKIKFLREKADYKQEEFSKLLDLSRASVVNIEKGRQTPSFYLIWKISKIFNIRIEYFLNEGDETINDSKALAASDSVEKKISEIMGGQGLNDSPDTINKLRSFVFDSLTSI